MAPLINTAQPNIAPVAVAPTTGVAQASNALTPQMSAPASQTAAPSTTPVATPSPQMGTAPQPNQQQQVAQIITQARQQGVPDEQIFQTLHDNGMIPTNAVVQPGQDQGVGGFAGAALGAEKGALGTLNNLSSLGQDFLSNTAGRVSNFLLGKGFKPTDKADLGNAVDLQAHGTAENVGKIGEQVGEFFLPGLGEADAIKAANTGIDALELGTKYGKAGEAAASFLKQYGTKIGAEAAGAAAVGTAQTGDIKQGLEQGAIAGVVSGGLTAAGKLVSAGLNGVQSVLEKSNLRLTPVQKTAFNSKLGDIVDYIGKHIPAGDPETRFASAGENVNKFENTIQNWLDTDAAGITVPKQQILDDAEKLKAGFKTERDALALSRQVDDFKNTIEAMYPDAGDVVSQAGKAVSTEIPVADLNQLKRSTFKNAFNQAGTKVSDAVEYQIGDMLKGTVEKATEDAPVLGKYPIKEVNKAYGVALNAQKLLKTAVGRPQVGFIERLLLDTIGFGTGGPLGILGAHAATSYAPVTATKALIGKAASKVGGIIPKIKLPAGSAGAISKLIKR